MKLTSTEELVIV
jgi:hypothetical protein